MRFVELNWFVEYQQGQDEWQKGSQDWESFHYHWLSVALLTLLTGYILIAIITFNIINQEMSLSVKIIINQNLAIKCPQILKYLINETRIMVFTHFIKKACQV